MLALVATTCGSRTAKLSAPRRMLSAVNVAEYTLFAGGFDGKNESDAVDIFDAQV